MSGSRGLQDTSTPAAAVSAGGDAGLRDTSMRTAGDAVGPSHSDDDERPRKKGRLDAGTGQGLVTQGVSTKKVLNQGEHGTCVGYAFSLVMTTGLQEKYGIACDPEKFVEKVKALCPCWEGHETESMLGQWNKKHAKPGAAIEDVDQRRRYNVKVDYTKITSFEEARAEMERQEALRLLMPCTISTDEQGHDLHAVALRGTAPGGLHKMEAVNSWGANQSLLEITPANFRYAIRFDPIITAAAQSGGVQIAIPPVRQFFAARVQEQDDKRKRAEQAKRDEIEKAERAKRDEIEKAERANAKVKAAATAAREVAAKAQKRMQDTLQKNLLAICTDPNSKVALTQIVGDLVHHRVDTVKGSDFHEVWRGEESLEGPVVLAEAIGYSRSLKTLDLSRCRVSTEGWDVLLRTGVAKSVSLTDLNISNNGLGEGGGKAVGKVLGVNTVLQTLNISNNSLGEGGGKAVGEALGVNTVLQTLDLRDNGLGEGGGKAVGEALGVNTVLQTLYLSGNGLANTVLQTLDLSRTFFDPGAAGGIARPKPERERGRKREGNRGRKEANITRAEAAAKSLAYKNDNPCPFTLKVKQGQLTVQQLGNLMVEKGPGDPTFHDESNLYPLGFKAQYADSETGTVFFNEVLDGMDEFNEDVPAFQVKIMREGQVEKTLVDKKPQGVWKQVMRYMKEHGTDQEKEAAKSWSINKLSYKFGLSNLEVRRRMEGLTGAIDCFKYKFVDEGKARRGAVCQHGAPDPRPLKQ